MTKPSIVERVGSSLGPFNRVVSALTTRLVPQTSAQAACTVPGYVYCGSSYDECWDDYYFQAPGPAPARRIRYFARHLRDCELSSVTCNDGCKCAI